LLLAFPTAAVLAKHSMTLIVSVLGVGLIAAALVRIRRSTVRPALGGTFFWVLVAAVAYLVWAGIGLILGGMQCGRCGGSWAQLAGEVLVFLPFAGLGLAKWAGVRAHFVLRALGIGLLIAALVLIVELAFDAPIYRTLSGRGADPRIDLSRFNRGNLALVLVAIPALAWMWSRGLRVWAVSAGAVIFLATLFGRSEAALLTAVVSVAIALLAAVLPRVTGWSVMGCVTVGSLAAPWIAGPLQVWRVETAQAFPLSIVHRFEIWDHAAHYARLAPWAGWGFGGYRTLPIDGPNSEGYVIAEHVEAHAHNVALQLWVETGVVGLGIWLGVIALLVRAACTLGPTLRPVAIAAIAAGLVPAMVSFGFWQATYLAILAMTAFALLTLRDADRPA
jgi:hypothetical protein